MSIEKVFISSTGYVEQLKLVLFFFALCNRFPHTLQAFLSSSRWKSIVSVAIFVCISNVCMFQGKNSTDYLQSYLDSAGTSLLHTCGQV